MNLLYKVVILHVAKTIKIQRPGHKRNRLYQSHGGKVLSKAKPRGVSKGLKSF